MHHPALMQREQENQRLRDQLQKGKQGVDHINNMKSSAVVSLGEMGLKMNGISPDNTPNHLNRPSEEFFVQNHIRNVDLTEEERAMINMNAQEVDALRMISQLPVGTELYQFKMNQFKELSMVRGEMEKMLQEQRLTKMRRDFEKKRREEDKVYDSQKFVDDWRKQILAARLRKDLNQNNGPRSYDPTEGFVIHWDYCLGVPKRTDYLQMVYGIYINSEEAYAPRMVEPHDCEVDTASTNRCIIGQSHHLTDIPANSNALLIFELQSTTSRVNGQGKTLSYAWSQLDIFDARRELK